MTHGEHSAHDDMDAGIYTWSLSDDRLYGDTAIAALFVLDPEQTIRGLPLSHYPAGNPSLYSGIVYPVKKLH